MIRCGANDCHNLQLALRREWLETNGLGGFASSTIVGLNTRRYHGLLVAAAKPPVGRQVLLAKLEETLVVDGQRFDLSTNQYPDDVHPQGYRFMKEFRLDPFPVFVYEAGGVNLEKTVFMVHGENTTVVQYRLQGKAACLEVRPLVAARRHRELKRRNYDLNDRFQSETGLVTMKPYDGLLPLYIAHDASEIQLAGCWFFGLTYDRERDRGYDYEEDLFNPFVLKFSGSGTIISSIEPRKVVHANSLRQIEVERRRRVVDESPSDDEFVRNLVGAADQFLVARGAYGTVIAGYPWFSDWGRDAMIALPGLTLATGRIGAAKNIFQSFVHHIDRGMIPNHFPDDGAAPQYETADATLWLFEAIWAFLAYTQDYEFVRTYVYNALVDVVSWHQRGTRHGIHVDATDGLLYAGEQGKKLTWMDAKPGDEGDELVTPRPGKAVEIQALWYNALRVMESLAGRFRDYPARKRYGEMAAFAQRNFEPLFWNSAKNCLYDVVHGNECDGSIRPNQIFAVSLPFSMLSHEAARSVVAVVEKELRTPFGLRTLAPSDPQYRGRYDGHIGDRDRAYHQGTVWPWLIGPFLTAYVKIHGGTKEGRRQAIQWLDPLREHLQGEGLGQLPEVFDGDSPQRPHGCIAQAWSISEILRVMVEHVLVATPEQIGRRGLTPAHLSLPSARQ